jgi:hypothetical protein
LAINDLNACLPESVTVVYQSVASDGSTLLAPTPYVVTLASLALPEFPADMVGFPGSKLFHCKTLATWPEGESAPSNDATLRTNAQGIATVYYRWLARATTDAAFAGVCPWSSSGLEGEIEWLHASDRIETRVTRPPWLEHQDELLTFGVPNAAPQGYPQLLFAQVCMAHQFALPSSGAPPYITPGVWYDTGFGIRLPQSGTYLLQADVFTKITVLFNLVSLGVLFPPYGVPQAAMYLALFGTNLPTPAMLLGSSRAVNVTQVSELNIITQFDDPGSGMPIGTQGNGYGMFACQGSATINVLHAVGATEIHLYAMITGTCQSAQVIGSLAQFTSDPSGALASTTMQYLRVSDLSGVYAGRGIPGVGLWEPLCATIVGGTGEGSGTGTGSGGGGVVETPCCGAHMIPQTLYATVSSTVDLCGVGVGTLYNLPLTYADGVWSGSGTYVGSSGTATLDVAFTCTGDSCQDFTATLSGCTDPIVLVWNAELSPACSCNPLYVVLVDTDTGEQYSCQVTE